MTTAMEFKDELKQAYIHGKANRIQEKNKLVEAACKEMEPEFKAELMTSANDGKSSIEFKLKTSIEYAAIFALCDKYDLEARNNYVLNKEYFGQIIVSGWDK